MAVTSRSSIRFFCCFTCALLAGSWLLSAKDNHDPGRGLSVYVHMNTSQNYPDVHPSVDVVVRTYVGDAHWLISCLRSIEHYGQIFRNVIVVFPNYEEHFFRSFLIDHRESSFGFKLDIIAVSEQEVLPNGYIQQTFSKLHTDLHSDADAFCFIDSDTILTRTIRWEDLYEGNQLLIRHVYWSEVDENHKTWKTKSEPAIGISGNRSFMSNMGLLYPREAFHGVRQEVEKTQQKTLKEYYMSMVCPGQKESTSDPPAMPSEFELLGLWLSKFGDTSKIKFIHRDKDDKHAFAHSIKLSWSWGGYDPMKVINNECHLRKAGNQCELLKSPCDIKTGTGCDRVQDARYPTCEVF